MNEVEEIKKRLDIVEFIGQYLQLKKVGINYSACCPFHQEKTPSFMVSSERQSFKCFGCGESGDVISFYQKIEMLNFPEALKLLGERTGVQVSKKSKKEFEKERSRKSRIYNVNLLCAKFFKLKLHSKQGEPALKYLKKRKISEKTIEKFKLGYAPDGDELRKALLKSGCTYQDIQLAGSPDRFRYRIMFPLFNTIGNIIGFSGRILDEVLPEGVPAHPKYLNTPETDVFHKSKALYGINLAKDAIRKSQRVVLVEGQMDVISSHEAGIEETVATSGTAVTEDHLKILSRYTPDIIFSFDEDEAGRKASDTAVKMALRLELEPKLTTIETYKDIGELVENDKDELKKVIDNALPPVEWLVSRIKIKNLGAKDKKELAKNALSYIHEMKDEIERSHYILFLAKFLSVPEISIEKALDKFELKIKEKRGGEEEKEKGSEKEDLVARYLSFLVNFSKNVPKGSPKMSEIEDKKYNMIYKQVKKCYSSEGDLSKSLVKTKACFERTESERLESEAIKWDMLLAQDKDSAIGEFLDIEAKLSRGKNDRIKSAFAQKISEAESRGDLQEVKKIMKELQQELKDKN